MLRYRLLLSLAVPVLAVGLLARVALGKERLRDVKERLAIGQPSAGPGPVLWLHAASNGELASASRLITTLLERAPNLNLVVTTNTLTGRDLARDMNHPRVFPVLAPIDHRKVLSSFISHWQPRALITIEGEIWPNRFDVCRARRVPVIVAGARMSERAAQRWGRRERLALRMMDSIRYLSAQDDVSERRFRALGLTNDRIGAVASLKAISAMEEPVVPPDMRLPFPRELTLLAASTHEGEEEMVLDAFLAARSQRPGLRLILAPRHPRRRPSIEAALTARSLRFHTRSAGQEPAAGVPVYLADTMGEMSRWYASSGMTFVGGSLVDRGGHTPFEPASFGSAILHGPHVSNFAEVYRALDDRHGAVRVDTAASLGRRIAALADPARQRSMARAASTALADFVAADGFEAILTATAEAAALPVLGRPDDSRRRSKSGEH